MRNKPSFASFDAAQQVYRSVEYALGIAVRRQGLAPQFIILNLSPIAYQLSTLNVESQCKSLEKIMSMMQCDWYGRAALTLQEKMENPALISYEELPLLGQPPFATPYAYRRHPGNKSVVGERKTPGSLV